MTALIIILSIVGYMAVATAVGTFAARTMELRLAAKAARDRYYRDKDVDMFDVGAIAILWPIMLAPALAAGIHERRRRAGSVKVAAEELRATEREQLEKDNARLERELGIGGQR